MVLDDGLPTATSRDQAELERRVVQIYAKDYGDGYDPQDPDLVLNRKAHAKYLAGGLGELPSGFISLDASRTWIVYWIVHSLELLGEPLPAEPDRRSIIDFLASCQHPDGGFGGGPYQLAHLAPTYAAVAALVTLGGPDALSVVDRPKLHAYLLRMCVPPQRGGGMTMNEGGEVDVRGCYCALAACEMLGLDKQAIADACGMVDFIRRCQSHEGGVGGEPWNEAHGGYSFCGLAAAALLGKAHEALDLDRFLRWAVRCQGSLEGGFAGRTAKLVDGCYSFWQGGAFPILADLLRQQQAAQPAGAAAQSAATGLRAAAAAARPAAAGAASSGSSGGGAATPDAVVAARLSKLLLGEVPEGSDGDASPLADDPGREPSLAEWVGDLPKLTPLAAVERRQAELQAQLDAAVEASLDAEEQYRAVAGRAAGGPLQQEALAALDRAADLQKELESCQQHGEARRFGTSTLLAAVPPPEPLPLEGGRERLPQLYDARALQLWLLKCCQTPPRGGLRDKPGKAADYYHTCYCLSGLSSSQHYSGVVLGGQQNLLAPADPLCNVGAAKLEAARRHFAAQQ
ncbi:farnesyltransferase subunit beta [Chlorella sorokiniana]|uniref:Farnesyltransferase subunit beta n=1 Tax=Chlorella sorokiniana TaxID=3076 RepID=A0A2P6TZI3_CHLSO|nr:farnesyltransferase subunit beta [Chlorella sorokiniana]|eukprot:PRW59450.1 farnesyltransferase subunit beta [Chlorella sorokiniana]